MRTLSYIGLIAGLAILTLTSSRYRAEKAQRISTTGNF